MSKSGHLRPRYGRLKPARSQYSFLYINVVGAVCTELVLCRVIDLDQIWDLWVSNIPEHFIGTVDGRIHNECKRSSPDYCNSLVGVQNALARLCAVHC